MILALLSGCNHSTQYATRPFISENSQHTQSSNISHLLDDLNLSIKTGCSTFDKRDVCGEAHSVHMATSVQIIKGIEDDIECGEPVDVELGILNVGMVCF
jgi:hypothetical protein